MHALDGGNKRLSLAQPSKVIDFTSGQVLAEDASVVDLQMRVGETRWFRLIPR